jgi:hypothetical protein
MTQLSIFDYYGKPETSKDEIIRYSLEKRFEEKIHLVECKCGAIPKKWFRSCKEYFIKCPVCGKQTKTYRHLYEADQMWNKGVVI